MGSILVQHFRKRARHLECWYFFGENDVLFFCQLTCQNSEMRAESNREELLPADGPSLHCLCCERKTDGKIILVYLFVAIGLLGSAKRIFSEE